MDAREHPRVLADQHVACRIGGRPAKVLMYDLSRGGCMAEGGGAGLRVGQPITLDLAGAPNLGATLVWVSGNCFGAQFGAELHAAIVEHYGYTPSLAPFETLVPRDRFGRALPPLASSRL